MSRKRRKIIIIVVLVGVIYSTIRYNTLKEIDKFKIDVEKYITYTDEISENKVQVNWKYVCAISAVLNNNNLRKISGDEIKEVASMFIDEDNNLESLQNVISELELSNSKTKRVYDYIEDLEYVGLSPSRLKEDSKHMLFINEIKDSAIENYEKYNILPSITIAQAILETGWGESQLSSKYNNLFGIKADLYWDGECVILETKEFSDTIINDRFRVYNSKDDSISDHARFLYENKRYRNHGVFDENTYVYQANALENAGYSTHMNEQGEKIYAEQLIQLIQQYNLQLIDNEVQIQ